MKGIRVSPGATYCKVLIFFGYFVWLYWRFKPKSQIYETGKQSFKFNYTIRLVPLVDQAPLPLRI